MEGALRDPGSGFRPGQQLRPLSIGEVLDAAIKLYRNNAAALWKIVAVLIVPVGVINQAVIAASLPAGAYVSGGNLYTPNGTLGTPAAGEITQIVLSVIAGVIIQGALAMSLVDAYIGHPVDWLHSVRESAGRLGALLWLSIIAGLGVALGFIALIIPGVWLLVMWCVAVPALMFEQVSGFRALGRSFELVRGRWWPTFAALFVAALMLFVALFLVTLVLGAIESALSVGSVGPWLVLNWLGAVVGDLIALPFIAAVIAVMYIDLRVRKEALDLELLAGTVGRTTLEPPPARTAFGDSDESAEPDSPPRPPDPT
jgi:hypothetical protein